MNLLLDQTIPRYQYEIIVCDSGSADGTDEMMQDFCNLHSNLIYIGNAPNILAAKRNAGIRRASAPIVIFMDDDVIPVRGFIEAHLNAHQGRAGVVFSGNVRFPEEWVRRSNYFHFRDSRHIGPGRPDIDFRDVPFKNLVVMNLSFKKAEVLDRVGFVSEEFIGYGSEDTEFGYRIWKAGLKIEFNEKALVYHYEHGGSIDGFVKKMYHTSRDSMPNLQRLAPGCMEYTKAKLLEPITDNDGLINKIKKSVLRVFMYKKFFGAVKSYLKWTDGRPVFYNPYLFRYLSACAYLYGCEDRKLVEGKKVSVAKGWFT